MHLQLQVHSPCDEVAEEIWREALIERLQAALAHNVSRGIEVAAVVWASAVRLSLLVSFIHCKKCL